MSILEKLISIYAPHICLGCGHEGTLLCDSCMATTPIAAPCCYKCKAPSRLGRTCPACCPAGGLVSVNTATEYGGLAKVILWSLKFDRAQAAADLIGKRLAELYGAVTPADALIVPVPTAMRRVRARGYDQATLIARSFAQHTGRTYAPLLMRLGAQEQKGAGRQQRHDQLQGAFRVKNTARTQNARIILIDDVVTTGATLEQAASTLRVAGARTVGALAFARA